MVHVARSWPPRWYGPTHAPYPAVLAVTLVALLVLVLRSTTWYYLVTTVTYTYIHIYIYTYTYIHIYIYTYIHIYIYTVIGSTINPVAAKPKPKCQSHWQLSRSFPQDDKAPSDRQRRNCPAVYVKSLTSNGTLLD